MLLHQMLVSRVIFVGHIITSFGLTDLIFQEGILNEFAYAQSLLFYKDSFDDMKKNQIMIYILSRME